MRGSSKTRILSLNFSSNNINRPLRVVGDRIIRVARNINENIGRSKIIEVGGERVISIEGEESRNMQGMWTYI